VKRASYLHGLTSDHHHGLVFCSRLKKGIAHKVEIRRLKQYSDWFWQTDLHHHFETEEKYLLFIADTEPEQVNQLLNEHAQLKTLFEEKNPGFSTFENIAHLLEAHIRFEEQTFFNIVEAHIHTDTAQELEKNYPKKQEIPQWHDPFWQ
jgi:hypothetical protein